MTRKPHNHIHIPHTPGPWDTAMGFHGHWPIFNMHHPGGSKLVALTMPEGNVDMGWGSQWQGQANAKLIADAPDLLATLKLVAGDRCFSHLSQGVRDAVATLVEDGRHTVKVDAPCPERS